MYRTHTCGELRSEHIGQQVTLSGWVQYNRNFGGMTFIDLRDRYGLTQLCFNMDWDAMLCSDARKLGREFVIQITGEVRERENKNPNLETGDIEIVVNQLGLLNSSKTPPFTIEDETDGGEEQRLKYRYLDLRRKPVRNGIMLRHKLMQESRRYLDNLGFLEIDTPFLIKSTPEGARDFVVPSRVHAGEFYALPQSPQIFKQLLMMSGYDRYFQIVKCFRDEGFRADRQPEFTQVDCEMAFVHQQDILDIFSGYAQHVFKEVRGVDLGEIQILTYAEAMKRFGSDKPDMRFDMEFVYFDELVNDVEFPPFTEARNANGSIIGIRAENCANYTRKQLDALVEFVKQPNRGMKGLVWARVNEDGTVKSSADKFFSEEKLKEIAIAAGAKQGDLILILAGATTQTQKALGDLRLELAQQLGLRDKNKFKALWVVDFPMFAYDEESNSWTFEHHPFTSPKADHMHLIHSDPGKVLANAYDFVINGWECCSGSIRIHDSEIQASIFKAIGLSEEEAQEKFGFLLGALEFGAPPHGGCAFGFDRLVALMAGTDSIRDIIPFPKNNAGKDLMLDAPSPIDDKQLKELHIEIKAE
ncbi:MAG: aspartate--tRNA ligase [Bacteroidia bacterium]